MAQISGMDESFLKLKNAAELIDVSVWTIRKWVKERRIRTYRFGRAVRIKKSDLIKFANVRPSRVEFRDSIVKGT